MLGTILFGISSTLSMLPVPYALYFVFTKFCIGLAAGY